MTEPHMLRLGVYGELFNIDLTQVTYIEADDHYSLVHYATGNAFLVPFGLSDIQDAIGEGTPLLRLGRSYIVNTRYIFHVNAIKQQVLLYDAHGNHTTIKLSKPIVRELIDWLKADTTQPDSTKLTK